MNGNVIANPDFVEEFATATLADGTPSLASPILSGWGSIMSVGQMIGHGSIPFVSNNFGRKAAMYWLWIILVCSIICESVATTWEVWLVGKFLDGLGVGSLQITLPTYIAEIAPIRIRGGLLIAYPFWFIVGVFFAPVALKTMADADSNEFRTPFLIQWGLIGLMIIIFLVLPESPAWLAAKGKEDNAKKQLRKINGRVPGYDVDHAYHLLAMTVEHEKALAADMRREKFYHVFRGTDVWDAIGDVGGDSRLALSVGGIAVAAQRVRARPRAGGVDDGAGDEPAGVAVGVTDVDREGLVRAT